MLALAGAVPLRYVPDQPPSKSYVLVPPTMLRDAELMQFWAARSIADALAAPARKAKKILQGFESLLRTGCSGSFMGDIVS